MSRPTTAPNAASSGPPGKKSIWSYENNLVLLFFFAVALAYFDRLAINFLMPYIQQDLGINHSQVSLLAAAPALTWAIAYVIGRRLSDKSPSKRMFLVILIIMFSVASMMPGRVSVFIQLLILHLVMGLFESPAIPVTQSVLATLAALFLRETAPRVLARRNGDRRPVTIVSQKRQSPSPPPARFPGPDLP